MRRSSYLQVLALLAMTIDHIGSVFFPEYVFMRIIGRLALPVFCYGIYKGFEGARRRDRYYLRLLVLSFVSIIPHSLALGDECMNICFSLLAGLVLLQCAEDRRWFYGALVLFMVPFMGVEYGLYGVFLILVFYLMRENKVMQLALTAYMTVVYAAQTGFYLQYFAVIFLPFIVYFDELKERLPVNRMVFYVYYPAHLFMIWGVKMVKAMAF